MNNEVSIVDKSPKFSIITPVYNSFHKMGRYFESLKLQTYSDFEVIVIDDCSQDDSYEGLECYADSSEINVRVFQTDSNGGPGKARNIGVNQAKGEWILFVDSDDYLDRRCLELIDATISENCDIIVFDYIRTDGTDNKKVETISDEEKMQCKEWLLLFSGNTVWGKAFRKNIIKENSVIFPELLRFEDWVFWLNALKVASNVKYLKEYLYYYFENKDSIVHSSPMNAYIYSEKAFELACDILKEESDSMIEALYIREVLYVATKDLILSCDKDSFWKNIDTLTKRYPNWYKNEFIKDFTKPQKIVLFLVKARQYWLLHMLAKKILK